MGLKHFTSNWPPCLSPYNIYIICAVCIIIYLGLFGPCTTLLIIRIGSCKYTHTHASIYICVWERETQNVKAIFQQLLPMHVCMFTQSLARAHRLKSILYSVVCMGTVPFLFSFCCACLFVCSVAVYDDAFYYWSFCNFLSSFTCIMHSTILIAKFNYDCPIEQVYAQCSTENKLNLYYYYIDWCS